MEVTFFIQRTTMYWRCWRTFCSHTWHCAPGQIKISVCQIGGGAGSRHLYTFIKTKRLLLNCKCSRVFFVFVLDCTSSLTSKQHVEHSLFILFYLHYFAHALSEEEPVFVFARCTMQKPCLLLQLSSILYSNEVVR